MSGKQRPESLSRRPCVYRAAITEGKGEAGQAKLQLMTLQSMTLKVITKRDPSGLREIEFSPTSRTRSNSSLPKWLLPFYIPLHIITSIHITLTALNTILLTDDVIRDVFIAEKNSRRVYSQAPINACQFCFSCTHPASSLSARWFREVPAR